MSKRNGKTEKERDDKWEALPESDQRFFNALIGLIQTAGDDKLSYSEPPAPVQRTLRKLDRNALFSIITECLGILLDAPALERVKLWQRVHEAEKRSSAAKKKSQAKHPAPKRRTTRKGRSK